MNTKKQTKARARARLKKGVAEIVAPKVAQYKRERREIAVGLLKSAPWNPREKITPESVADLTASIATLGVIQPLVAMLDGKSAVLISGHRRLVAAKAAGLESVPCDILMGVDEATARRMTFVENLQRKEADPLLESGLVASLVNGGMTQAEIASETGRGKEWVARRLNLANLSASWRKRVKDGEQITTDCLEHVAAYPEKVQERLKAAKPWYVRGALRWSDIQDDFRRETQDLKGAEFDRAACKTCPNNTGCNPDLFDWDGGKAATFGKCLDKACFRKKSEAAVKEIVADAKANGCAVRETKDHPDYSLNLQSKPDAQHTTLYVWKGCNGETVAQWGEPSSATQGGGMSEEQKEARRKKIATNKARRKLAEWCVQNEGGLADALIRNFRADYATCRALQDMFSTDSAWCLLGSKTNMDVAARSFLMCDAQAVPAGRKWAEFVAEEIAHKLTGTWAERTGELLCALSEEACAALTEEERRLVVSDEKLAQLRNPGAIVWMETEGEE